MTKYQYRNADNTKWVDFDDDVLAYVVPERDLLVYQYKDSGYWNIRTKGQWRVKPNNPLVDVDPNTFGVWCINGMSISWVCQHNRQVIRVFTDGSFLEYGSIKEIPIFTGDVVTKVAKVGDTE